MNKRGSHADWAISMGIFLIYLLVLFIIIRPGIEPIHNENTLLDIAESKFNKDVKWVVKMTPLIVEKCLAVGSSETKISVDDEEKSWTITNLIPDKVHKDVQYCVPSGVLTCGGLKVCPEVRDVVFDMYYVPKTERDLDVNPKLKVECSAEAEYCKATLGSSEDFEGIRYVWLSKLIAEGKDEKGYDVIKERWTFPESRDFSIYIDGDQILGGKPYENANIYVREWEDWYVYDDGERKPVKVSINIW